jgi:hypothetical protein
MAEYQARKWNAWHHHIGLTMVALMFLAKERLAHRETIKTPFLPRPRADHDVIVCHPRSPTTSRSSRPSVIDTADARPRWTQLMRASGWNCHQS